MTNRQKYSAPGPWDDEPDLLSWIDEETNLHCHIRRNSGVGILCGYVELPPNTSTALTCNATLYDLPLTVHGGITFVGHIWASQAYQVVGFDCGHAFDLMPASADIIDRLTNADAHYAQYRDIDFVKNECTKLAKQIRELSNRVNQHQYRTG